MLQKLWRSRMGERAGRPGDGPYLHVVAQARRPDFYTRLGVADEIDARFELYTLHVLLLVLRLRDEGGAEGPETAQDLFEVYVSALDHTLRELGVGDISVGKKMRKLGESLYGRMVAYEAPLRATDASALAEALDRNVYAGAGGDRAGRLADYALETRRALAEQSLNHVLAGPAWAEIPA